jgi:phytoene dehydrogenase-like protein
MAGILAGTRNTVLDSDVIVIGAGLTGLACALRLQQAGINAKIIEASEQVGGRIATDERDGFLLDRGFQVLQTWYPEARHLLDYEALDLRPFYPGALVRIGDAFHRVSDIWRHPERLPEMLLSPVGSLSDKLRLLALRRRALKGSIEDLYARPESTALQLLREHGFSQRMQERFFKPFFAGVFFEPELEVSSRAFEFVFRAFALGDTALPAQGMAQIPLQLAERLVPDSILCGLRVQRLLDGQALLEDGARLRARAIVIATEGNEAARLLGAAPKPTRGTTCLYFAAPQAPFNGPYLVLNGTRSGIINSLLCPSNLAPAYAPPGEALIAVNVFGTGSQTGTGRDNGPDSGPDSDPATEPDSENEPDAIESAVRSQLLDWYGEEVHSWRRLAVYRLPAALPMQLPPVTAPARPLEIREGLWVSGEYAAPPSIHWALASGNATAAALIDRLRGH